MLKELNILPRRFAGGGHYCSEETSKIGGQKCSPSMYEGGVKLDSYCLTRDRS